MLFSADFLGEKNNEISSGFFAGFSSQCKLAETKKRYFCTYHTD